MKSDVFIFEGEKFIITSEYSRETERGWYQVKKTDITRERELFAWRPWWIGRKFRWLKKIKIRENLIFIRYSGFDDGWSYQEYWKKWGKRWDAIEIL